LQVLESRAVATEVVKQYPLGLRVLPIRIGAKSLDDVAVVSEPLADTIHLAFKDGIVIASAGAARVRAPFDSLITIGGIAFRVKADPHVDNPVLVTTSLVNAANNLAGALSSRQRKATDVIDVMYVSEDPYQAQQIVNAAVGVFRDVNAQTAQAESRRRREFLGEQVAHSDSLLREAAEQLSAFRSAEHLYGGPEQVTAQQAQLLAQEEKRQDMAADRDVLNKLLATIQQSHDSTRGKALRAIASSPSVAANPIISGLYQQLMDFELIRDSLTADESRCAAREPHDP
jgi:uncharacterized protein involved in exopolysaccharide biosynthesis